MVTKLFGILLILSFFVLWGISLNKHEQPVPINTVLTREQTKPYNPDIPIVENWKGFKATLSSVPLTMCFFQTLSLFVSAVSAEHP